MYDLLIATTQTFIVFIMIVVSFTLSIVLPWRKIASATTVLTTSIIFIFIVIFLMTSGLVGDLPVISDMSIGKWSILSVLGFYPRAVVEDYMLHQFITETFIHFDFIHVMFNFFGLLFLGAQLEQRIGWQRFLMIYFGSAVIANCVVLAISPFDVLGHSMDTAGIGASGGIFGILGALWYLYPRDEIFFPLFIIRKWPISLIVLIYGGASALFILLGTDDDVSHVAHFAGLIGSFPIAFLVRPKAEEEEEKLQNISEEELRKLAKTKEQKIHLKKAVQADEKDVRDAWLEEFFSEVKCPKCEGKGMNYDGKDAICNNCGKRIRP
jgi:membrane associated rhomboid family serine protease